jgi:hypothetical protein
MKKILIATDLSKESLELMKEAIHFFPDEKLEVILGLGYRMPANLPEIWSFKPRQFATSIMSADFRERLAHLRRRYYDNIKSVQIEFFSGVNIFSFRNFITTHNIEIAFIPSDGFLKYRDSRFFSLVKFIRKSGVPFEEVEMVQAEPLTREEQVKLSLKSGLFTHFNHG